jgi:hypothetical protein
VNLRSKAAILALLALTSCQDSCWLADYTFVREGEHITVYGYDVDESDACAGSFEGLDDYTERVREFLGIRSDRRHYYMWMSPEFFAGFCPKFAGACARDNTVFTPRLPDMHEVTHVLASDEWGETAYLLEEGLATYLEEPFVRERLIDGESVDAASIKALMTARSASKIDYAVAGHFVSFLVETRGIEAFTELYQQVPDDPSLADWQRSVTEVYGVTLDGLLAEYEYYPLCSDQQYRAKLWGCDGEPDYVFSPRVGDNLGPASRSVGLAAPASGAVYEFEADCSDPRAMNWITDGILITRLVQFTEGTQIQAKVEIDGEPVSGPVFMAQECLPCLEYPLIIAETTDEWTFVYPGNYIIMLTLDASVGSSIKLTLTTKD